MKHLLIKGGSLLVILLSVPALVQGQTATTADVLALIQELKDEIKSLKGTVSDLKVKYESAQVEIQALKVATPIPVPVVPPPVTPTIPSVLPPDALKNARDVQAFLKNYPDIYPEGLVTGFYGSLTRKAIQRFFERYSPKSGEGAKLNELVFGIAPSQPIPPAVQPTTASPSSTDTSLMQQLLCPALFSVASCPAGETRTVTYSSPTCGTYYSCVPSNVRITTSTQTVNASSTEWRRIYWGRGGSSLVPPSVPQATIDAALAAIVSSCPNATYYDYQNPSDTTRPNTGIPSCPSAQTTTTATGCAKYGSGWHSMDASGNCFDPEMKKYRDSSGLLYECSAKSASGCSGTTSYAGDENSCPGFSYSRWDSTGKRYCQLNNERKCDYTYPSYLTNGANYKAESCPASDSGSYTYTYTYTPRFTEPTGGCSQYSGGSRATVWTLHGNALGGSCTSGARPANAVSSCPSGQWPSWDENGWPVSCASGSTTTSASSTSSTSNTSNTTTNTTGTNTSGSGTTSGSGGSGYTYAGDANSCPGFSYSRWDSTGKRYCQLNNERKCDYTYPSYLTNGANYTTANCPATDSNTTGGYYSSPPAGQKEQTWNSLGLRSWIRTDADTTHIETLKTACANVQSGANIWMPSAGDSTSQDFGMPDPSKCSLAAQCTSGQYFDGATCAAGGSYGGGGSYYTGGSSSCGAELTALLGSGCHSMGNAYFDSGMIKYVYPGTTTVIECSSASISGCSGSSSYSTGGSSSSPSCPSGQYWNGTACQSSGSTSTSAFGTTQTQFASVLSAMQQILLNLQNAIRR